MRRIRVMQLVTGLAVGDQVGGAEQFGLQLALHLDQKVFESSAFGFWRYNSAVEQIWLNRMRREGVTVGVLVKPTGNTVQDLWRVWKAVTQLVDQYKPDIINSHSERGDFITTLLSLFHPQHPLAVRTMHTDQQWQSRPGLGWLLSQLVFPWVFVREMAVSEAIRQVLDNRALAGWMSKKSIKCYNALPHEVFESVVTRRGETPIFPIDIPNEVPLVGIIGRLTEQKGHSDLIDAFRQVVQTENVHLLIVGTGPLEIELRRKTGRLRLDKRIHFLGARSDVLSILPKLRAVVVPSLWEGFPTIILEAMASGVPVIATDVSGSRELILPHQTGWLVPPKQPDQLAEAIRDLLKRPDHAQRLALAAQQRANEFSWERTASCYMRLYQEVAVIKHEK